MSVIEKIIFFIVYQLTSSAYSYSRCCPLLALQLYNSRRYLAQFSSAVQYNTIQHLYFMNQELRSTSVLRCYFI